MRGPTPQKVSRAPVTIQNDEVQAKVGAARFQSVTYRLFKLDQLDEQSVALQQLTTTALQRGLPALVLSHRLYGDVSHEGEVVDLNHLANPAKVPAGVDLTVVSNG